MLKLNATDYMSNGSFVFFFWKWNWFALFSCQIFPKYLPSCNWNTAFMTLQLWCWIVSTKSLSLDANATGDFLSSSEDFRINITLIVLQCLFCLASGRISSHVVSANLPCSTENCLVPVSSCNCCNTFSDTCLKKFL